MVIPFAFFFETPFWTFSAAELCGLPSSDPWFIAFGRECAFTADRFASTLGWVCSLGDDS
jgi:hypothetical protein